MRRLCPATAVVLTCALFTYGCSDDSGSNNNPWPDGGSPPPSEQGVQDGGGTIVLDGFFQDLGAEPDLVTEEGGPTIQVLTPAEGGTVIGSTLEVKAKITDSDGIDDPTVMVTLQGQDQEIPMTITVEPDIYRALVDVSNLRGQARLWVTAQDLLGKQSSQVVAFERDPGPVVLFLSPGEASRHKGSVSVQIAVADRVEVTSFSVRLGSQLLTLNQTVDTAERAVYAGTIKFDDPMFNTPLTGTQVITAEAVNANGAGTIEQRLFVIDEEGPTITVKSHAGGDLIGGVIELEATVDDEAGVVESSVKCIIGNNLDERLVTLLPVAGSPGVFTGQFDTRTLPQNVLWPVMSFRAADELGNESHFDIEVGVDNGQPRVDLDPPNDFVLLKMNDELNLWECSHAFDPVGDDAASDGEVVPQVTTIRARIEDQGNGSVVPSAEFDVISGVDDNTVWLYVLDDTAKPLVVDTTGDGYCDAINPEVVPVAGAPSPSAAVAVNLEPKPPTGKADFTYLADPVGCISGTEVDPPPALCSTTEVPAVSADYTDRPVADMTVAISHSTGNLPSIYAPPKIDAGSPLFCAGLPFDFRANQIADGWVCVAAAARDELGMLGVSKPMRLFVDLAAPFYAKGTLPPSGSPAAPDCTGTLDKASGVVNNTPCKFRAVGEAFPQLYADGERKKLL